MKLTELINKHGLIAEQSISDQWALYSGSGHTEGEIVMLAIAQGEALDIIVTRQFEETDTSRWCSNSTALTPCLTPC